MAIVKTPEVIEMKQVDNNEHEIVVIYMDSKITLDSIRSAKKSQPTHRGNQEESSKPEQKELENRI
jgi:hypothetical protein